MNRRQSYVSSTGFDVLFDGSKTFWKTRSNLDILIASHMSCMCVEVIAYDALVGKEAPRLYISTPLLVTKIDREECDRKLAQKKETILRQRKAFDQPAVQKEVINEGMVQFILSRLGVVKDSVDSEEFSVVLAPISTDTIDPETNQIDVLCLKPEILKPIQVNYQKKATAKDMKTALKQLESETAALQRATKMCELVTSSVDGFKLMLAEKMRLDAELKSMYSEPRLRWINAINRVLIQNYIAAVHERLMKSNVRDWYIQAMEKVADFERRQALEQAVALAGDMDSGEDEDTGSTLGEGAPLTYGDKPRGKNRISPARSKMLRRSLDNSQLQCRISGGGQLLPQLSPQQLNHHGGGISGAHAYSPGNSPASSGHGFAAKPVLPLLQTSSLKSPAGSNGGSLNDAMERRRLARAGKAASPTYRGSSIKGLLSPSNLNAKQRATKLRRSFTEGESNSGSSLFASKSGSSIDPPVDSQGAGGRIGVQTMAPPRTPPSLMKSYSENVPKLLEPVSLTAFGDVTRSAKTKRPSLVAP